MNATQNWHKVWGIETGREREKEDRKKYILLFAEEKNLLQGEK